MGIEFAYSAETAFVSPTLLGIGIQHRNMTLIWCLSPMIGFFLTPLLGSFSDRCKSRLGRRRPFIILLSIGIILGQYVIYGLKIEKLLQFVIYTLGAPRGIIIISGADFNSEKTDRVSYFCDR
jgi:hypothetical protein